MKAFLSLVLLSQLQGTLFSVYGFPAYTAPSLQSANPSDELSLETFSSLVERLGQRRLERRLLVDPLTDSIEVTGDHEFVAPDFDAGDQRGPCPGLNALANHGYISRDGITSFTEVVTAINEVYGMGIELALVLGIMGTVWTGNPLSLEPGFSIGGPSSSVSNILGNLGGLLGTPRGLQGSHNWIESDSSLTRNDMYVTGDSWTMNMTLFEDFHSRATDGALSFDLMAEQAARRFDYSVAHNPNFYYGPVTGMISRNAGYLFTARLLANHSLENPDGVLSQEVFKSFFAVIGDDDNMEYKKGWERIPENWYRRPVEYGLVPLNLDLVEWVTKYPVLGSVGGNTGTVNSFSGLQLNNITNGVLNADSLLENNNLLCFVFEVIKTFAPDSLSPLFKVLEVPLQKINDVLAAPLLDLSCPAFEDLQAGGEPLWDALQNMYPGAASSNSSL